MEVLVAGKGFIGSAIGEKLEGRGHSVEYLDRSGAEHVHDITVPFSVEKEFDALVHTVGLAPGFSSEEQYRKVHVEGTENLLEGVEADSVVYVSALGAGEVDHSFFRTKERAEDMVRESEQWSILRPSTVYGRGNRLLELIRTLSVTRLFPRLGTRTQPILLQDLAEMAVSEVESPSSDVLNAAGPEKMTLQELAARIYRQEGRRCFGVPAPEPVLEASIRVLSFLPPPFERENVELLRQENTTSENHAEEMVELGTV